MTQTLVTAKELADFVARVEFRMPAGGNNGLAIRYPGNGDTAYVGNDINDADCLRAVGVPVVPADAWPEVKPLARWVLSRAGGTGCVREFCDAVWEAQR
jgi:hypothetical protein